MPAPHPDSSLARWITAAKGNVLVRVLGLLSGVVVARTLGSEGRGLVARAILSTSFLVAIGSIIGTQTCTFFIARSERNGWLACRRLAMLNGLGLLVVAIVVNSFLVGAGDRQLRTAGNMYAVTALLSVVASAYSGGLLAEGRIATYWNGRVFVTAVPFVLTLALAFTHRLTLVSFVLAIVMGHAASVCYLAASYRPTERHPTNASPTVREILKYGSQIAATQLPHQISYRVDQVILIALTSSAVLGNYAVAVTWSSVTALLAVSFASVILSDSVRIGQRQPAKELATQDVRGALAMLVFVGTGAAVGATAGIPLVFGRDFSAAIAPAMILSVGGIFYGGKIVLQDLARGLGHAVTPIRAEVWGAIVTLALLVVLVPRFQGAGAAVASLVAYGVAFAVLARDLGKALNLSTPADFIPSSGDFARAVRAGKHLVARRLPS